LLEQANLVLRTRVSRSEFRFRPVAVPAGTSEETTNVRETYPHSLHERAMAMLRKSQLGALGNVKEAPHDKT
jgi:hypothetical protein